jgi:hypothetical protein
MIVVFPFGVPFAEQKPPLGLTYTSPAGDPLRHADES